VPTEHNTFVQIDPHGQGRLDMLVVLPAAGVGITSGVIGPPPVEMTMDHPFFYAIEDSKTGELLFIGLLMNPSGG
jgi:serpin B